MLHFRDYCEPYSKMWNILKDENELKMDNVPETTIDLSDTLNKSLSMAFDMVVIYASDLQKENKRYLNEIASKNKIKIVSRFQYVDDISGHFIVYSIILHL